MDPSAQPITTYQPSASVQSVTVFGFRAERDRLRRALAGPTPASGNSADLAECQEAVVPLSRCAPLPDSASSVQGTEQVTEQVTEW